VCVYDAPIILANGTPPNGTFSGLGISGGNTFNPAIAGIGTHTIFYTVVDGNSCIGSDSLDLEVKECLSIEDNWPSSIIIAPNPASDMVYLSFNTGTNGNVTIKLFSLDGKVVYTSHLENTDAYQGYINISNIANGVYMLQIETMNGTISRKLIKK
ncbi:MAG: T9SS type A sorting domain-containing protein, partial [Flavobacteriales bacterium]|nr:T9SS type A sorting domain-containing protein [Flavobacteriales bacterium]MCZ2444535.1 T9SS type A sorting domain-containing protein [Flavobacteriales bacterium]